MIELFTAVLFFLIIITFANLIAYLTDNTEDKLDYQADRLFRVLEDLNKRIEELERYHNAR